MLGFSDLKPHLEATETIVPCPVLDCPERVARQRKVFLRDNRFKCPAHGIYISPSTFEYEAEVDNLLWWKDNRDFSLLGRIKSVKRESRMARDNSEDAVTWNVFRFLEKNSLTESVLSSLTKTQLPQSRLIYWSYDQQEDASWSKLNEARVLFGESIARGSEPDVIVVSNTALLFIEAKLTASNETVPSEPSNSKKYQTAGGNWFSKVFQSDYRTIAISDQKYELLRFWLIGTWMANQLGLDFRLVNLVPASREQGIEPAFGRHITQDQNRMFVRLSWEDIYHQIVEHAASNVDKQAMLRYFQEKTIGYDPGGNLHKAFSISL